MIVHRAERIDHAAVVALWGIVLISVASTSAVAQEGGAPIIIGHTITIRSEILHEDRRINVYVPTGYEISPDARYPVLYQLDGSAHGPFHYLTGVVDYLSQGANRIPQMIVVGIPNPPTNRTRDLAPPLDQPMWRKSLLMGNDSVRVPSQNETPGGADTFLRFLTEELVPEIDRRYRTAPFRLLVGHSLGGLFVTHALLKRPESFNAYVAASPALHWNDRALARGAQRALAGMPVAPRFFFMSVGDREDEIVGSVSELTSILDVAAARSLRWWYRVMPGETHTSNPVPTYAQGLTAIFADWALPEVTPLTGDVNAVEARFAKASETYGYAIKPPEGFISGMGGFQLLLGRVARAIDIFERNTQLHPASPGAWDNLAGALEAAGRLREALERREEAVRRAAATRDPRLEALIRRRDELRRRVSGQ